MVAMTTRDYEAVVVGAGPNGLMGAITLAQAGCKVLLLEAGPSIGGGMRSAELTQPGFIHDICSTVHPLAVASPAFRDLKLEDHGVEWRYPEIQLAHPLDNGRAALLQGDVGETAQGFNSKDARLYERLINPLVDNAQTIVETLLSPFQLLRSPITLAQFGLKAIRSADALIRRFDGDEPKALITGSGAHSMRPLTSVGTAGYGLLLTLLAHTSKWPVAVGGSQKIADALGNIFTGLGGEIVTNHEVRKLSDLPPARATLFDVTPRQLLNITGDALTGRSRRALERFRYGAGVFKIDWALSGPIPWTNPDVHLAGTVHLGGTSEEIKLAEAAVNAGQHAARPYVLVVQPTNIDPSRAPSGGHIAWAYCHVPNGSTLDQTKVMEDQIERFAPGFRDLIIERHTMSTVDLQAHNANYVGGDINGGAGDFRQMFTRPSISLNPWATSIPGVYLCSSSTPPGGGVHGMCGLHAARLALRRSL